MEDAGRIELSLPPNSRYMRLARLMASGVATTCGLPLEEVEDFRIAVDELCATLMEIGTGEPVRLAFLMGDDTLVVEGRTASASDGSVDEDRLSLSRQILDVVTDGHRLSQVDGQTAFTARKHLRGRGVG
jgi:serine/threonine-protein kinase RsbW